jgi:hypothetical protein
MKNMDIMYSKIAQAMQRQHTPITPQFVDVDWRWQICLPLVGRFNCTCYVVVAVFGILVPKR